MDNRFTTEIVRDTFGPNVAPIVSTCKCSYQRASGRIYVASNAICFYSNILGFERKILIPVVDITFAGLTRTTSIIIRCKYYTDGSGSGSGMKKEGSSSSRRKRNQLLNNNHGNNHGNNHDNNGQQNKDSALWLEEEHLFKSFDEREAILRIILGLLEKRNNETQQDGGHEEEKVKIGEKEKEEEDDDDDSTNNMNNKNKTRGVLDSSPYRQLSTFDSMGYIPESVAVVPPTKSEVSFDNESMKSLIRGRTYSDPATSRSFCDGSRKNIFVPNQMRGESAPEMEVEEETINGVELQTCLSSSRLSPLLLQNDKEDHQTTSSFYKPQPQQQKTRTFDEVKASFKKSFPERVIDSYKLPNYSVDEFYKKFLHDEATHSLRNFQETIIQDKDVVISDWVTLASAVVDPYYLNQKRSIMFNHPRNSKLGPSNAHATRQQVCTIFPSSSGILLETGTKLNGVPYCDCFIVEEQWIIDPYDTGVKLSIRYKINFVKPTMMKKIIVMQTHKEIKSWYKAYMKYLSTEEGDEVREKEIVNIENHIGLEGQQEKESFIKTERFASNLKFVLFFFILVYIAHEIHSLRLHVIALQNKMLDVQNENLKLLTRIASEKSTDLIQM